MRIAVIAKAAAAHGGPIRQGAGHEVAHRGGIRAEAGLACQVTAPCAGFRARVARYGAHGRAIRPPSRAWRGYLAETPARWLDIGSMRGFGQDGDDGEPDLQSIE